MEIRSYKEIVASKIVELREDKGYTQDELAQKTNLSRGQISMYETGKRMPSLEVLDHLAKFFGVHIGYFVGDDSIRTMEAMREEELKRLLADVLSDPTIPDEAKGRLATKILGLCTINKETPPS